MAQEPYSFVDAEINRTRDKLESGKATTGDAVAAFFYAIFCFGKAIFALVSLIPVLVILYFALLFLWSMITGK